MNELIRAYSDMFGRQRHVDVLVDMVSILTSLERLKTEYEMNADKFPEESVIYDLYCKCGNTDETIFSLLGLMRFMTAIIKKSEQKT